ncbi:monovalent cation/H+ antiporter subunit D family protein [Kocuria rhizophila]|uniref:monovalent cation/H+ antiporter subunit D family protein n=1 Tax=Kocuria rhizophila TaxID=72000 RepID=UPI001E55F3CD|nr:monovalent cation/H+ antiporter subunit D family protein [Kocuria rhizophila]
MIPASSLPLYAALPILVGAVLVLTNRRTRLTHALAVAVLLLNVAAGALLVATVRDGTVVAGHVGGWDLPLGITFVADLFGALMVTATGLLTLVCLWFAIVSRQTGQGYFSAMVLILTGGVNGALLTGDLFNLFVFIEVMLLPSYALLVVARRGRGQLMQVTAPRIYITVNLLASTLLLAGIGLVYGVTGTVNLAQLWGAAAKSPEAGTAFTIVLVALSVKAAAFPVHGWLPRTYPFMSPAVTALFSGLHTKVGVYALFRLYAIAFDGDERYLWIGATVFALTMIFGVLGAVGQTDARAILSFHMVSQIGYILMGLALFTPLGLAAGVFYLLHHMFVKASLFLSTGAVELVHGRHTLGGVSGLGRREPLTAIVFFVAAMSLAGIPPFSGFVAKLTLIVAALDAGQLAVAVVAVVVSLFTILSMLKIWGAMFMGEPQEAENNVGRVSIPLILPAFALAGVTIGLGLGAEPLLALCRVAAAGLTDPSTYVEAVVGA